MATLAIVILNHERDFKCPYATLDIHKVFIDQASVTSGYIH